MITKIIWPQTSIKGNPFGGVEGYRPITITLHSSSFANILEEDKTALEIIIGLSSSDDVDTMSFDGSVLPKIFFDDEKKDEKEIALKIINSDDEVIQISSVSKSFLDPRYISRFVDIYRLNEEEKNRLIRQDILEIKAHEALDRDIFVTSSDLLLKNKDEIDNLNISTPREALKIIGLYLRMKGESEWITHKNGNVSFTTSRRWFYQLLSRGLLPNSWKYISGLGKLNNREKLVSLGWSVMNRYSRAIQSRDEIGRLFFMQKKSSSEDQMAYHFDYLTLLLTAALDVQALIIKDVYGLKIKDNQCGFRRSDFQTAIKNISPLCNLATILANNEDFINILFELRNKIHSVSLETDFYVPESYPDELLERMFQYEPSDHWGIQKRKVTLIKNRSDPVPSIDYIVDLYNLAHGLVNEATKLINTLMEETKIENYLDTGDISKISINPPADMLPYIQTYLLLA